MADILEPLPPAPVPAVPPPAPKDSPKRIIFWIAVILGLVFVLGGAAFAALYIKKPVNNVAEPQATAPVVATTSIADVPEKNDTENKVEAIGETSGIKLLGLIPEEYGPVLSQVPTSSVSSSVVYLTFSPDGQRYAYLVVQEGRNFVVIDGKEGKKYQTHPLFLGNYASIKFLEFSPDSKHLSYIVTTLDEKAYAGIKQAPYLARESAREVVVTDDSEGKVYSSISSPGRKGNFFVYSADSSKMAYTARVSATSTQDVLVINGKEEKLGKFFNNLNFNSKNEPVFAEASRNGSQSVLITPGGTVPLKRPPGLLDVFKDDSISLVIFHEDKPMENKIHRLVDGKEVSVEVLAPSQLPIFSADGKKVAYTAVATTTGPGKYLTFGENKSPSYTDIWDVRFSPDNNNLSFISSDTTKKECYLSLNFKKILTAGRCPNQTVFGTEGKKLAFVDSSLEGGAVSVADISGSLEKGKVYDQVWNPVFVLNDGSVRYNARNNRELLRIVEPIK